MPRAKPDSVEVQRIELGSFERRALENAGLSRQFSTIYTALFGSIPQLIATSTIVTAAIYGMFPSLRKYIDLGIVNDFISAGDEGGLSDYLEAQNLAAGAIGFVTGGIPGLILSQLGVELGEEVVGGIGGAIEGVFTNQPQLPIGILVAMQRVKHEASKVM